MTKSKKEIVAEMLPSVIDMVTRSLIEPAKAAGYETCSFSSEIEGTHVRQSVRMRIFYDLFMPKLAEHFTSLGYRTRLDPTKSYIYFYWGEAAELEEAVDRLGPFKSVTRSSDL